MVDTLSISYYGNAQSDELSMLLKLAFDRAMRCESYISQMCLDLPGMSGRRYRMLINNLIRTMINPRYLEVGSWAGSTCCSVLDQNRVSVKCIDNWSEFGGPKQQFYDNTDIFTTSATNFMFFESDFRQVDVGLLGVNNVYLFDGPHLEKDQYDGLYLYDRALDDAFVFIVDDWNWNYVRSGTLNAIRETGFHIDYAIEIRTTLDNQHAANVREQSDWHNGYLLAKLTRVKPRYQSRM